MFHSVRGTYREPQTDSAIMVVEGERAKPKSATLRMGMPRGVALDLDAFKFYLAKRDRCEGMPIMIPSGFRY